MTADMVGGTNEYKCTARNILKNNQHFEITRTIKFVVTHNPECKYIGYLYSICFISFVWSIPVGIY